MVRVFSLMSIDFVDAPYTLPLPLMWSIVEEQLAIVAANLPILRHVLAAILPHSWMGSSRRKSTGLVPYQSSHQNQKYSLTRMDAGKNKTSVSSTKVGHLQSSSGRRWSDDERSEVHLAANAAPPDGIQVSREFRVS